MTAWHKFSPLDMPPHGFVLVYVEYDQEAYYGQQSRIAFAYYSHHDGYWRNQYEKLSGNVTHWMELPAPPEEHL